MMTVEELNEDSNTNEWGPSLVGWFVRWACHAGTRFFVLPWLLLAQYNCHAGTRDFLFSRGCSRRPSTIFFPHHTLFQFLGRLYLSMCLWPKL